MASLSHWPTRICAAASITALLAIAACGSSHRSTPHVATLSAAPSASAVPRPATGATTPRPASSSANAAPIRLRLKLNGTPAEENAAFAPYYACFRRHGINASSGQGGKVAMGNASAAKFSKATKDCAANLPLPPIENDPKNPHAIDFNRAVAACLRTKGVRYVEVTTDDGRVGIAAGGPNNDPRSISLTGQYLTPCEERVSRTGH